MRQWILMFLLILGPSVAQAQIGGEAAPWLGIPTDMRSAALAGSTCSNVNSTGALETNPAGLALMTADEAALSNNFWIDNVTLTHAAFGAKAGQDGFAVSGDYLNLGSVQGEAVVGNVPTATSLITPYGLDIMAGYGFHLSKEFIAGVSGRFFGEYLGTPFASSVAGNAGLMYQNPNGLSAGFALLNAGPQLSGFSLPLQTSLGAGYHLALADDPSMGPEPHQFSFTGQWDYFINAQYSNLGLGLEYTYRRMISIRAGYKFAPYGDNASGVDGIAAGLGLHLDQFDIAYALANVGSLGLSNQVELTVKL